MEHGAAKVPEAAFDVRVGGKWSILMRNDDGDLPHYGTYRVIDRPHKLEFTWISQHTQGLESVVTVELQATDGGTTLTLNHSNLPDKPMAEAHNQVWTMIMDIFAGYLEKKE